jgi:hypothetical protein
MCPKVCVRRKKLPIRTTIRADGVSILERVVDGWFVADWMPFTLRPRLRPRRRRFSAARSEPVGAWPPGDAMLTAPPVLQLVATSLGRFGIEAPHSPEFAAINASPSQTAVT